MDMYQYQVVASRTMQTVDDDMLEECAWALHEESGEVIGLIKKHLKHGHPLDDELKDKVRGELGDLLYYLSATALLFDITLDDVATANLKKIGTRYPQGFSTAASIARVDTHE